MFFGPGLGRSLWSGRRNFSTRNISKPWTNTQHFRWFLPVQTRWKDNDQYLHVNNAVYHAIFDSVINVYLIRHAGMDPLSSKTPKGYMVTNSCSFKGSCRYPESYLAGLGVSKLGNSSVHYQLALFKQKEEEDLELNLRSGYSSGHSIIDRFSPDGLVMGESIHVFVDPASEKPTPIPQPWRTKLELLTSCTSPKPLVD